MEARFSALVQTGPGAQLASCAVGIGSLPGVRRVRGIDTHLLLEPRSKKDRTIPVLPLWASVDCFRVNFTFPLPFYGLQKRDAFRSRISKRVSYGGRSDVVRAMTTRFVTVDSMAVNLGLNPPTHWFLFWGAVWRVKCMSHLCQQWWKI